MKLSAHGWSHLGLRVTDLARAKRFYVDTLGCPLVRETEGAVFVTVAGLLIVLLGADAHTPGEDHFDPFRVGLDHLALAVEDSSQLADLQRELDAAGVRNHRGVELPLISWSRETFEVYYFRQREKQDHGKSAKDVHAGV